MRTLFAAGETDLLRRTTESLRRSTVLAAKTRTAVLTGQGLLALEDGQAEEAAQLLARAAERERSLGRAYDAAVVELDLARALEATGDKAAASEVRSRAEAFLAPLGCVNPF